MKRQTTGDRSVGSYVLEAERSVLSQQSDGALSAGCSMACSRREQSRGRLCTSPRFADQVQSKLIIAGSGEPFSYRSTNTIVNLV